MERKPSIHFGSFDAERYWRPENRVNLPAITDAQGMRIIAEMDQLLSIRCRPDDILMARTPFDPALRAVLADADIRFSEHPIPSCPTQQTEQILLDQVSPPPADYTLMPYAVTDAVGALQRRWQSTSPLPDAENVSRLSSKTWSNQWVRAHQLPGDAEVITDVAQLRGYASGCSDGGFIIKDPYGVAGRGAIHITSPSILENICRHLDKQVATGKMLELLVQPFFPRLSDFSAHLAIGTTGSIEWLGLRQMQNNGLTYNGSGALSSSLTQRLTAEHYQDRVIELAADMAREGYFGPICIDAMLLNDNRIIPVLEVNPRVSMGLLSLLLEKKFAPELGVDLCVRSLKTTSSTDFMPRFLTQLARQDLLAHRDHPGILPLSSATVLSPRGRLYFARVYRKDKPEAAIHDDTPLIQALTACGASL
ncbi:hypothetical protein [Dickeya dianthicola]|uniref:hypothetical protein n=1 Tax=Dickeya dianthicola TaxID=204039 RepID=UPI0018692908|nr:hypothetical protein [Dickeya dianthicola]QOL15827.1 hypothetical protein HGI48_17490 [Dickeya dianthicola]